MATECAGIAEHSPEVAPGEAVSMGLLAKPSNSGHAGLISCGPLRGERGSLTGSQGPFISSSTEGATYVNPKNI